MKKNILYIAAFAALFSFSACNEYLDKLPDDRAIIDTEKDINDLLASCYPSHNPNFVLEMSSDNMVDNGDSYNGTLSQEQAYLFEQITSTGNDDPRYIWNSHYTAVATANQVLESIDEVGAANLQPQRAEALLCRAFSMLELSRVFCMAYNPENASQYLGLAYPTFVDKSVDTQYDRGTLEELYANINKDIEEALPLVDDEHLSDKAPKYHFNRQAAYALAARFNLYYQKWDKAVQYATEALGADPAACLRDMQAIRRLNNAYDMSNQFISTSEAANFLLQTNYSLSGRILNGSGSNYRRYGKGNLKTRSELGWGTYIWGSSSVTPWSSLWGNSNYNLYWPKMVEKFEYTDKIAGTGYAHTVIAVFTGEECLLIRAEANALLGNDAAAIADLNLWYDSHLTSAAYNRPLTQAKIDTYFSAKPYSALESGGVQNEKKELHPQGFANLVNSTSKENLINLILHFRRLDFMDYGLRFQDLKRYGISFSHNVYGKNDIIFETNDLRGAIQLPLDVIAAGATPNPRNTPVAE